MYRICIAGRPNVGKSTLFNRLYGRRFAITDSMPGVTRDAVAVETHLADRPVLLVDTGGIGEGERELDGQVYRRSKDEIARADLVLLLVEVAGLTGEDEELLELVRRSGKPAIMVGQQGGQHQTRGVVGRVLALRHGTDHRNLRGTRFGHG